MKKGKRIVGVILFFATILCACSREEEVPPKGFTLNVLSTGSYTADIEVRHNGTNRDTWCGFVVVGHGVDIKTEIAGHTSTLDSTDYLNQKKREIHLISLSPEVDYTYIVVGIDDAGHYNGCYNYIEFTTKPSSITATINPNWSVIFKGQELYKNGYYSKILVRVSTVNEERFIMLITTPNELERFPSVSDYIAFATETYEETHNTNYDADFWIGQGYSVSTNFYRCLDPGQYIAYAIGIDASGKATGSYAVSEPFSEVDYPMTPGYSNLIGNWKVVDADGVNFVVAFSQDRVNRSLIMTGWGGTLNPIKVNFYQKYNTFDIHAQLIEVNASGTVNGQSIQGNLYFHGWYKSGGVTHYTSVSDKVAVAEPTNDDQSSYAITSAFYVTDNYTEFDCPMGAVLVLCANNSEYYNPKTKTLFPLQMTKL